MSIELTAEDGLPHLWCHREKLYCWELFKFVPHSEGWVVLGWEDDGEDMTCLESYEFGEDLQAALVKFAEVSTRNPRTVSETV